MPEQNTDFYKKIIEQNNLLIRLLALDVTEDCKNLTECINVLADYGFRPSEIAQMLDKPLSTITSILARARKKATRKKAKRKKAKRKKA